MKLLPDVVAYAVAEQVLGAEVGDEPSPLQVWVVSVDEGSENVHQQTQVGIHSEHDPWTPQTAGDDS